MTAGGIQNLEDGNNQIYYEYAEPLAKILEIPLDLLMTEYTRFANSSSGIVVKRIRYAYEMTQEEFSRVVGVTRPRLSVWEAENYLPTIDRFLVIKQFAKEHGINIEELNDNQ